MGVLVGVPVRVGVWVIVAEGVEVAAERDCVRESGCDLLQGYLFARPGPPFPAVARLE